MPCPRAHWIASVSASWIVSNVAPRAPTGVALPTLIEPLHVIVPSSSRYMQTRSTVAGARSFRGSFLMNISTPILLLRAAAQTSTGCGSRTSLAAFHQDDVRVFPYADAAVDAVRGQSEQDQGV